MTKDKGMPPTPPPMREVPHDSTGLLIIPFVILVILMLFSYRG